MGTTPTPIQTPAVQTPSWIATEITWIKAHEKLLIAALAAFLLFKTGQGIEHIVVSRDQRAATIAANTVAQDPSANKTLTDQLATMKAAVDAQTAKLNASIASSNAALAVQQKKDAASTPSRIDARWQGLLPLKPGSVTELSPNTTSVTNDAANQTVQALEQIPVLESEINSLTSEVAAQAGEISKQNDLIVGLSKQIIDETAKDTADVKLEKAKAKKSFWKGLKIGIVIGAVGTEAVRIWVGKP
jgi:small-conductance mechanosensitive channel